MEFDDDNSYDGGYQDGGFEYADGGGDAPGLPEGHYALDQPYLTWVDNFATQLYSDETLLARFNEWIETLGESGEQEARAVQEAAGSGWPAGQPSSSPLADPGLRQQALSFLRKGREGRDG